MDSLRRMVVVKKESWFKELPQFWLLLKDFNKFRLTWVTLVGEDEIITEAQAEAILLCACRRIHTFFFPSPIQISLWIIHFIMNTLSHPSWRCTTTSFTFSVESSHTSQLSNVRSQSISHIDEVKWWMIQMMMMCIYRRPSYFEIPIKLWLEETKTSRVSSIFSTQRSFLHSLYSG